MFYTLLPCSDVKIVHPLSGCHPLLVSQKISSNAMHPIFKTILMQWLTSASADQEKKTSSQTASNFYHLLTSDVKSSKNSNTPPCLLPVLFCKLLSSLGKTNVNTVRQPTIRKNKLPRETNINGCGGTWPVASPLTTSPRGMPTAHDLIAANAAEGTPFRPCPSGPNPPKKYDPNSHPAARHICIL
jgi:hypothetical protein